MKRFSWSAARTGWWGVLALTLLVGVFLRCYLLADQVFTDDEWHGFYYALGKSPGWLLTHFSIPGATCIPLNCYIWLLGKCGGWSEIWLRMPSLVGGVLVVLVGPLLAREIIGVRRSIWLALLLAVSPILIFYSRLCRPYSAVALLGYAALLLAARWQHQGGIRWAVLFAMTGVLAVYFHLFAAVAVVAPLLVAMVFQVYFGWYKRQPAAGPHWRSWLIVGVGMAALGAVLILPALIASLRSTFFTIALAGTFKLESLPRVAMLISGTEQPVLNIFFWGALVMGAVEQCRRNPWFGLMLLSLYPLHVLALLISRPDCAQSAIVLTRYGILLVPVSLLLVACGIQAIFDFLAARVALRPALQAVFAVALVAALAAAGPLPQCYLAPNNFTNHGAYQHRYSSIDWKVSFYSDLTPANFPYVTTIRLDEVSPFYGQLAKDANGRPIVEYPMLVGDHFNPLYYYQHFHRRPVLVGYTSDLKQATGLAAGNVYGSTYIDQVLSLVERPAQLRFQNLISLHELAAMRARNVEYLILHKFFEAQISLVAPPPSTLSRTIQECRAQLGEPAYEDAYVVVFRL